MEFVNFVTGKCTNIIENHFAAFIDCVINSAINSYILIVNRRVKSKFVC